MARRSDSVRPALRDAGREPMGSAAMEWVADVYDPDAALVVEVDSFRFHASPTDAAHDAWRDSRLAEMGIHVERVTEADLLRSPKAVVARIRHLRRTRRVSPAA